MATASTLILATPTPTPSVILTSSRWSFTQGFLVGQASFLVLCGLFIKYVVFEDAERSRQRTAERTKKAVLSTTNVPPPSSSKLLEKTGYEMATHASESADWINVLFAQVLQGYRDDLLGSGGEEGARKQVETWLNPKGTTSNWLDPITVTSLSLGNSYPLLSNARIRPADGQGGLRAEVDVDYADSLHLSLATSLVINFPQPRFAILPVALGVELVAFGGTVTMQLHGSSTSLRSDEDVKREVHLSLLPDFQLNLKATSLLGSRAKLQDIPKLEQLVIARLRQAIQDRLVWPRFVATSLPRLVARGREPTVEVPGAVVSTANVDPVHVLPVASREPATERTLAEGVRDAALASVANAVGDQFRHMLPPSGAGTPSFPGGFGPLGHQRGAGESRDTSVSAAGGRLPGQPYTSSGTGYTSGYGGLGQDAVRARRVGALNAR